MANSEVSCEPDEVLAAEYVLQILPETALARFEARLRSDPDLQHRVNSWRRTFGLLSTNVPDVAPGSPEWRQIEGELRQIKADAKIGNRKIC